MSFRMWRLGGITDLADLFMERRIGPWVKPCSWGQRRRRLPCGRVGTGGRADRRDSHARWPSNRRIIPDSKISTPTDSHPGGTSRWTERQRDKRSRPSNPGALHPRCAGSRHRVERTSNIAVCVRENHTRNTCRCCAAAPACAGHMEWVCWLERNMNSAPCGWPAGGAGRAPTRLQSAGIDPGAWRSSSVLGNLQRLQRTGSSRPAT
jgi:hypothetical protein